jgi:hypothetical protein
MSLAAVSATGVWEDSILRGNALGDVQQSALCSPRAEFINLKAIVDLPLFVIFQGSGDKHWQHCYTCWRSYRTTDCSIGEFTY